MADYYCLEPDSLASDKTTEVEYLAGLHILCYHVITSLERFNQELGLLSENYPARSEQIKRRHWSHLKLVMAGFEELSKDLEVMLEEISS